MPEEHDSQTDDSAQDSDGQAVPLEGKTVPVERFNGANRKISELQKQVEELKGQLGDNTPTSPDPAPQALDGIDPAMLGQFMQEFQQMKLETARNKAVEEYPALKPLRPWLQAGTEEDLLSLAKEMNEALSQGATPAQAVNQANENQSAPPPSAPPVGGGSAPLEQAPSLQEDLAAAIKDKDWSKFLEIKYQQASA